MTEKFCPPDSVRPTPEITSALNKFEKLKGLISKSSEPVFMESGDTMIQAWISPLLVFDTGSDTHLRAGETFNFRQFNSIKRVDDKYDGKSIIEADISYDAELKMFRYTAVRSTGEYGPDAVRDIKQFGNLDNTTIIDPKRAENIIDAMIQQITDGKKGEVIQNTRKLLVQNFSDSDSASKAA